MSTSLDEFRQAREDAEQKQRSNERTLSALGAGGSGPREPSVEGRIGRLEDSMKDVKAALGRLEPLITTIHAQMPHLATKAELERVRGEVMTTLAGKPGVGAMWAMGITLFALVVAAMSAGAIYLPLVARMLRQTP